MDLTLLQLSEPATVSQEKVHHRPKSIYHTKAFKVCLILALFALAFALKGDKLTVGALFARVCDFVAELFTEHALIDG